MTRLRRLRDAGDDGSALAIALTFLMVFGLIIGVVLQFATTGQRTTIGVREEATNTYSGGGALDGAINAIRSNLSQGTQAAGSSTCFTIPADQLGNPTPVAVTCTPRSGSGASIGGSTASQPGQAVLTRSASAAEGVVLEAGANVPFQGEVAARALVSVPAGASLSSTDSVTAGGTCVGTTSPPCTVVAAPADPGLAGPSTSSTPVMANLPGCTSLITLSPGIYRSAAALQDVLNCATTDRVVWFQPGTYFFDFTDAVTHELVIGAGDVVVGGTPSGWTPGLPNVAVFPPYPTAGSPAASACDTTAIGVDLVFGGDSRLTVKDGAKTQFCALATSTTAQHIVLRSSAGSSVASTGASGATASSEIVVPNARRWMNADGGAVAGGTSATVKLPNSGPPSKLLVGPVSSTLVPADATGITVTTTVRESLIGTGNSTLAVRPGNGGATLPSVLLRDCPTSPCGGSATGPWYLDTATTSGLSPAQVNAMSFEVIITNPNTSPIEAWIDGVTVTVTFSVPIQAAGGTVTGAPAYTPGSATTTPLLLALGATTVLALHGTVYAPAAVVDLGLTGVPYTVIDRGLVVRHLQLSMTPAGAGGPPLISIPSLGQQPRRVLLTTSTGARADVTFANAAGTRNGNIPTVLEWSVS